MPCSNYTFPSQQFSLELRFSGLEDGGYIQTFLLQSKKKRKEKKSQPSDPMLKYPVLLFQSHKPQELCYFLHQLDNFDFCAKKNNGNPVHPLTLLFSLKNS